MCLDGKRFEHQHVDIDFMFKTIHSGSTRLFFGVGLARLIIERQRTFVSDAESFIQMVKV